MVLGAVVGKAAGVVLTGLAGAVALEGVKKAGRAKVLRAGAVTVTAWGLRGARAAETGAEKARLAAADIVSEARGSLGEQSPPPGGAGASDGGHDHEH
ncbi:MAG: DUF1490 family protein [Pseudonocardia sp.]